MKVFVIDINSGQHRVEETDASLEDLYRLTDSTGIDITSLRIDSTWFDFIVDDEGLLKRNPYVTALSSHMEPVLVGNLVICHHDSNGEIAGLSDADIKLLEDNLIVITDDRHPGCLWEALMNVK